MNGRGGFRLAVCIAVLAWVDVGLAIVPVLFDWSPVAAQTQPVPTPIWNVIGGLPGSLDPYYAYVCGAQRCCNTAYCAPSTEVSCEAVLAAESQEGFGSLTSPLPSWALGTTKSCVGSRWFIPPAFYKNWLLSCSPTATCSGTSCPAYNNFSGVAVLPNQATFSPSHWNIVTGDISWDTDNTMDGSYAMVIDNPIIGAVGGGGGMTQTNLSADGYVIGLSFAAQNTLSTKTSTAGGACQLSWERQLPWVVPPVGTPTITPTLWVVTPTITPMITPVPSVTALPCIGIACPPDIGSTPYPTPPGWVSTPMPTPTGPANGEIGIGKPVAAGCFTFWPRVDFESPDFLSFLIPKFGLHMASYELCIAEAQFTFKIWDWNIGAWLLVLVAVAGAGVIISFLKRA